MMHFATKRTVICGHRYQSFSQNVLACNRIRYRYQNEPFSRAEPFGCCVLDSCFYI